MNISLGYYNVDVKIIYKNNRNIYFRFDENGTLIVTCPKNTLNDDIARYISENEDHLIKMYEKALEQKQKDNEFWYLGEKYNVVFVEGNDPHFEGENFVVSNEEELEKFIDSEIDRVFNEEIEICKKCFYKLPEFTLKTRKMKTRWGVNNRRNNTITLNTELIKKRVDLIDYVIIHEMVHFFEGNHSRSFWKIVKEACPDYKKRRADLRK